MKLNLRQISANKFILGLSIYFTVLLNQKFWTYVYMNTGDTLSVPAIVILPFIVFAPLYILFNLITVPYIGKPLITLLLICSALADYAMKNLSIVLDSDMVRNMVETNSREALDLVTVRVGLYMFVFALVPAIWINWVKINYDTPLREIKKRFIRSLIAILLPLALAPISYKEYVSFGRNHKEIRHYMNTFNYIFAVKRYYKKSRAAKHEFVVLDSHPQLVKKQDAAPRVFVYIVGETARAANFSLYGYNKETNPELKKEDIVVFKNMTSCGTSTAISLPCMFSSQSQKHFKVSSTGYVQNLMDIIQASGYDVFWKDNDDGCKEVCNRVPNIDAKKGNKQPYCFSKYCQDDILLDGLEERIAAISKDTVIVLHTMGSHGPTYYKRYPKAFDKFKPTCDKSDLPQCNQNEIINTYDNTILYTDYVVASVIRILKNYPQYASAVLYVSDHGESLGENNLYLHGLPYAIAPKEQKQIPMIWWLSDKIKQDVDLDMTKLTNKAATDSYSHDNLFHSILHILSIKTTAGQEEREKLDIFL